MDNFQLANTMRQPPINSNVCNYNTFICSTLFYLVVVYNHPRTPNPAAAYSDIASISGCGLCVEIDILFVLGFAVLGEYIGGRIVCIQSIIINPFNNHPLPLSIITVQLKWRREGGEMLHAAC